MVSDASQKRGGDRRFCEVSLIIDSAECPSHLPGDPVHWGDRTNPHTDSPTMLDRSLSDHLRRAVKRKRLLDTAVKLVAVPSRTGEAGAVADALADLLRGDGFSVERIAAGHD